MGLLCGVGERDCQLSNTIYVQRTTLVLAAAVCVYFIAGLLVCDMQQMRGACVQY
jgi:hypothetical protein